MKVVHIKKEPYDIRIDRSSKWGNPFSIGVDGNRRDVILKHAVWLLEWVVFQEETEINGFNNKWVVEHLHLLDGQTLGCWCAPKKCHGDNLIWLRKMLTE